MAGDHKAKANEIIRSRIPALKPISVGVATPAPGSVGSSVALGAVVGGVVGVGVGCDMSHTQSLSLRQSGCLQSPL